MAFDEGLDGDMSRRIVECQHSWALRYASGLQDWDSQELIIPDALLHQLKSEPYWQTLLSDRRKMEKEERALKMANGQAYIPGIPDEIVENHIWPLVQKSFRGISSCKQVEKEERLSILFSIRLLNKRWEHVVNFSYDWAVYRMVRRDFNVGWMWYSYLPTLRGPFTELSRMMDLLPDPSNPEWCPNLHISMGVMPTKVLWLWRSFLNMKRRL